MIGERLKNKSRTPLFQVPLFLAWANFWTLFWIRFSVFSQWMRISRASWLELIENGFMQDSATSRSVSETKVDLLIVWFSFGNADFRRQSRVLFLSVFLFFFPSFGAPALLWGKKHGGQDKASGRGPTAIGPVAVNEWVAPTWHSRRQVILPLSLSGWSYRFGSSWTFVFLIDQSTNLEVYERGDLRVWIYLIIVLKRAFLVTYMHIKFIYYKLLFFS